MRAEKNALFCWSDDDMREVTKLMINEFKIKKLGYDFMGYSL